jgi:hypothetical protein
VAAAFAATFFKNLLATASFLLMAAFCSGSAFLSALLSAATFLAALSCFFKAALLTGETAFLRAFLMFEILTEIALGALKAFTAALANFFWALISLALMAFFSSGAAFLKAFFSAATFLAALSCFFKRALLTGFFALASFALMAAILLAIDFLGAT